MKSFIIHLSKIESSLSTARCTKEKLENFNIPTILWEGVYGSDAVNIMSLQNRQLHPWTFKGPDAKIDPQGTYAKKASSAGVRGCFLSHYSLWKHCVDLDEPIMIWEDDIDIHRGYIPVDWEDVLVLALGHPSKSEKYKNYLENPDINNPKSEPFLNASMPGCCGYAIKPHAARKLIDTYNSTYLPADNAINQHLLKIQIHNCIMGIAMVKKDGKKSLTRTNFWETYK
jgi:GR25 family glycosyltransferase involved in LPS biosynthesis